MIKDLRNKTDIELGELISKLKVQLLETRFKMATGETENIHKRKEIRKTIAMAMTVLSERKVKVSFSTFDTQLIKNKDGKQEIKTISSFEEKEEKKTTTPNNEKETSAKKTEKTSDAKDNSVGEKG